VGVAVPESFQGRSWWKQISAGRLTDEIAISELVEMEGNPLRSEDRMRPRVLAVRDSRYKLVIRFKEGKDYLYDLKSDPGEHSPLRDDVGIPERVRLLKAAHTHLQKSRENRNTELALIAGLRQIKHSMGMPAESVSA
jgi:hypothetical protein